MNIEKFISRYNNHPVIFVGTGISLRYLNNSYTWDGLLKKISDELGKSDELYFDVKSECQIEGQYNFQKIATTLERKFNELLKAERKGRFEKINDIFYQKMKEEGRSLSRFKIYISDLLNELNYKPEMAAELIEFKKIRKNIGSIITTNYDTLIEDIFEFNKLIGNDILLSNPYGSVYKIHGCVNEPDKIIITENDYDEFDKKYDLIRAQLLSLFIHNPIIFLGYGVGDDNIKKILKTIFTYVAPNSELHKKIRDNFLLVEYDKGNDNLEITEHDIDMEGFSTIRINKLKTDNFIELYKVLSNMHLPISAMDVRKVQSVVKEIYSGGEIKVTVTEDLDSLKNGDKILAIGSAKTISYNYQSSSEMICNYFNIIDESNAQLLTLINYYKIQINQYFPVFGFDTINSDVNQIEKLKKQQKGKLDSTMKSINGNSSRFNSNSIEEVLRNDNIPQSLKTNAIFWNIMSKKFDLDEVEVFLRKYENKEVTDYRKLLCAYDYMKYNVS